LLEAPLADVTPRAGDVRPDVHLQALGGGRVQELSHAPIVSQPLPERGKVGDNIKRFGLF